MSGYTIKAIPTRYRDVLFRSRLEATWAAYFDLLGEVAWAYEPFDLDGWAPDLLLRVRGFELLVEIKPIYGQFYASDPSFEKAVAHWQDYWVVLLGIGPGDYTLGVLMDQPPKDRHPGDGVWLDVHEVLHPVNARALWAEASNITRWKGPRA